MSFELNTNQIYYLISFVGFIVSNILLLIFSGKYEGDKSQNSIILQFFNRGFHMHHWMIALILLFVVLLAEHFIFKQQKLFLTSFLKGVFLGMLFHGITYYSDYFKF